MSKGNNVRLTEPAHQLLADSAKNLDQSMKEVASEAIISLFKRELKYNEYIARINWLEDKLQGNKRYAFGTFALGALTGGCLVSAYFLGML